MDGLLDTVKAMNQPSMLNTLFYVQTRKCAEAMLAHSEGEERQMQMGVKQAEVDRRIKTRVEKPHGVQIV